MDSRVAVVVVLVVVLVVVEVTSVGPFAENKQCNLSSATIFRKASCSLRSLSAAYSVARRGSPVSP